MKSNTCPNCGCAEVMTFDPDPRLLDNATAVCSEWITHECYLYIGHGPTVEDAEAKLRQKWAEANE